MKKILLLFNGIDYPSNLIHYAIEVAKSDDSLLQAVVMRPVSLANISQYPFPYDPALAQTPVIRYVDTPENTNLIKSNLQLFKDECTTAGIKNQIEETVFVVDELIEQSAFCDLIITDAKGSFGDYSLEELLADTHCPVLVVTEKARLPRKAILCYDESFSSMYAIKQYSYLFPQWSRLPTELVSINPKGDKGLRYHKHLESWLPEHFLNIQRLVLEGNLRKELVHKVGADDVHSVVVMGAYGRNAISRLFHRSLANVVFEETNTAVFIIHE